MGSRVIEITVITRVKGRSFWAGHIKVRVSQGVRVLLQSTPSADSAGEGGAGGGAPRFSAALCDFGSACALPAEPSDSLGVGTPGWMAPELLGAAGTTHAGCACDVYSLGSLLYELTTGRLPYANLACEGEMMQQAAAGRTPIDDAPLPADTPPPLAALMRDCLELDARRRPHARLVCERLARLLADLCDLGEERRGSAPGPISRSGGGAVGRAGRKHAVLLLGDIDG